MGTWVAQYTKIFKEKKRKKENLTRVEKGEPYKLRQLGTHVIYKASIT